MRSIFSCPIRPRLEKDIPKPPCPAPELNPQKKSKLHLSLRLRRLSAFESTKDNKASTWSCMGLERFRPLLKTNKHSVTWASMVGPFLAHTLLNLPTSVQHRNRFFDQLCIGDAREILNDAELQPPVSVSIRYPSTSKRKSKMFPLQPPNPPSGRRGMLFRLPRIHINEK